jgi:plastocyanin
MPLAASRLPRLLPLAVAVALLGAGLVLAGGDPVAAQGQGPAEAEVNGTAQNKWDPATVNIRPGGTITFKVAGGVTHPVKSGTGPEGDDKFDSSDCTLDKMQKVGDSCTVKIAKAGSYPFFCEVHFALGMTGTITVGSGGNGQATTTTAAGDEIGGSVVEPPSAAAPPSAGRPAIYWAGWGLLALGALLALALVALYVRFGPGFNRQRR